MQKIEFIKMHGLGNDFVIIDNRINSILITPSIINKLSDRKFGAGCDQLITINKSIGDEDARIEIFNPMVIKLRLVVMEHDVLQNYFLKRIKKNQ